MVTAHDAAKVRETVCGSEPPDGSALTVHASCGRRGRHTADSVHSLCVLESKERKFNTSNMLQFSQCVIAYRSVTVSVLTYLMVSPLERAAAAGQRSLGSGEGPGKRI